MAVYVVDKPLGPTSHDVVARARRLLGTRRVGHAGTLDPLATGVLVLLGEGATKLSPFLTGSDKSYLAWVAFGVASATHDAEGPIVDRSGAAIPPEAAPEITPTRARALTPERVADALPPFLELRAQLPPRHSAVQVAGVRSYAAARRGEEVALEPRPAGYRRIELLAHAEHADELPDRFAPGADGDWRPARDGRPFERPAPLAPAPTAVIALSVAAGTYVRAFARDLGVALGTGAYLAGLVRVAAGGARLEHAVPLEDLPTARGVDPVALLPFPRVTLDPAAAAAVRDGKRLEADWSGRAALVDTDGALVAVADAREGAARSVRVWREPP